MTKFEQLKKLVLENGTEKMKELLVIVENYIEGLDNIFKDRDVTELVLREFDFPMFLRELHESGTFQNKSGMQVKLLVMDIYFIVRHVWEFTDNNGNLKTGDNLRKAWPLMYEDDKMMDVENLFKQMKYI